MGKWKLTGYGSAGEYHFVKNDKISNKLILLSIVSTNILGDHYKSNKYAIFLESFLLHEIKHQNDWIRKALLKSGYLESEFEYINKDELISNARNYYGYNKKNLLDILNSLEEAIEKYKI